MGHWEVGDLHWLCFSLFNTQNLNLNFESNASDEKVVFSFVFRVGIHTLNNLLVGLVGRLTDWVATLAGWAGLGWAWLCLAGWLSGWAGWLPGLAVGKKVLEVCFEYMAID